MSGTGSVVFDYGVWAARYPELAASVNASLAAAYFGEAGLYLANTGSSPVTDLAQRAVILNMITAHIAAINAPIGGQPASGLVGRITSASEGSVSVTVANTTLPGTAEWFATTKYGFAAWQALAPYRTMRYVPGPGARRRSVFGR